MSVEPDLSRYQRQMLLPSIGEAGQRRLLRSHAAVVGCGALGTVIADLLCRAGVGTITIIDRDVVELTNLQRQTLFTEADADAGMPKADAAAARLAGINSQVRLRAIVADLTWRNAERLVAATGERVDIVVDGTDNFHTRFLMNDLCVKHGIPFVYAGAVGMIGTAMTVEPGRTPCLRCIMDQPPPPGSTPTCETAGVLGPLTAMMGAYEASEAIRLLAADRERTEPHPATLLQIDLAKRGLRTIDVSGARDAACACCGQGRYEFLDGSLSLDSTVLCGRNAVQVNPPLSLLDGRLDLGALALRLAAHGRFVATRTMLRGVLRAADAAAEVRGGVAESCGEEPDDRPVPSGATGGLELTVFPDGRAIVRGTTRPEIARAVYAKYIGA